MTTVIHRICVLLLCCCHVSGADITQLDIQCRDWASLAIRCAKVAPNTTLSQADVQYLAVRETCCVIAFQARAVTSHPGKYDKTVPDFCANVSTMTQEEIGKTDYAWRLSLADKEDGGYHAWPHAWTGVVTQLQQACNPMALVQAIGGLSSMMNTIHERSSFLEDTLNVFMDPILQTKEWKKPKSDRKIINAVEEIVRGLGPVRFILDGGKTIIMSIAVCLAVYALFCAYVKAREQPVLPMATSVCITCVYWYMMDNTGKDWLYWAILVVITLVLVACCVLWFIRRDIRRLESPDVVVVGTGASSGVDMEKVANWCNPYVIAQGLISLTYLHDPMADMLGEWAEYITGRRAQNVKGSQAWFVNEGANAALAKLGGCNPNTANGIKQKHQRDAALFCDSIAARVKADRR